MSGVGEEASGVGKHAHKTGQITKVCKGGHLLDHAGLVIIEPPCATLLDLCNSGRILEAADNSTDYLIVYRV